MGSGPDRRGPGARAGVPAPQPARAVPDPGRHQRRAQRRRHRRRHGLGPDRRSSTTSSCAVAPIARRRPQPGRRRRRGATGPTSPSPPSATCRSTATRPTTSHVPTCSAASDGRPSRPPPTTRRSSCRPTTPSGTSWSPAAPPFCTEAAARSGPVAQCRTASGTLGAWPQGTAGSRRSTSSAGARRWRARWAGRRRSTASTTTASSRCASGSTRLLDPGSFHEIGAHRRPGRPTTDGDLTDFAAGQLRDGPGPHRRPPGRGRRRRLHRAGRRGRRLHRQKQVHAEQMANELRLPIVRLVDGTGGGGSVKALEADRRTYVPANPGWEWVVDNLATVPVVALALGSVAGLGAARVVASHYSLMVRDTSQVFVAGPPRRGPPRRGGRPRRSSAAATSTARNGTVDDVVDTEEEAFERTRRFLSYLPSSVDETAARAHGARRRSRARREDWLIGAIPRDRRKVYASGPSSRPSSTTARSSRSARAGAVRPSPGWPASTAGRSAVLAARPVRSTAAGWTADASQKVDALRRPGRDVPPPGGAPRRPARVRHRHRGASGPATIRHGARALAAVYQATVPWCSVILRKVFGVGRRRPP